MSLLDGYSRYNQILVHKYDQLRAAFTTPWGTFMYAKMPFGLKNARATFQWAMDIAFSNEKDIFLVIYLDDLTVFSKSDEDHLHHLRIFFQKCRKFGISLSPKKSLFSIEEGKLLGHIISKDGIRIDPAKVEVIQQLDFPRNKKQIQSFNGKINFLRRFIPNLAEHFKEMTNMLKKDSEVKWSLEAKKSFHVEKFDNEANKKNWHNKLINALWADRVNTKNSIGMSPFQLVYGVDIVFASSLVVPVMKILQELDSETNDIQGE